MGTENGIIAGMKHPNWEIQNRAVAQPLVVGRMAAMLSGLGRGGMLLWDKAACGTLFPDRLALSINSND